MRRPQSYSTFITEPTSALARSASRTSKSFAANAMTKSTYEIQRVERDIVPLGYER
jgi:hypothetical protein